MLLRDGGERFRGLASRVGGLVAVSLIAACASAPPRAVGPTGSPRSAPSVDRSSVEEGLASWYGDPYHGRATASGSTYDMWELTAAHRTLPFGTRVRVTNLDNGRTTEVVITDRGPFVAGRIIDLSRAAADAIGAVAAGVVPVRLEVESVGDGMPAAPCWEVQVGAFGVPANVDRARRRLAARGLGTRTVPAGGGLTRVRVTGAGDRSHATAIAADLQADFPGAVAVPCGGAP